MAQGRIARLVRGEGIETGGDVATGHGLCQPGPQIARAARRCPVGFEADRVKPARQKMAGQAQTGAGRECVDGGIGPEGIDRFKPGQVIVLRIEPVAGRCTDRGDQTLQPGRIGGRAGPDRTGVQPLCPVCLFMPGARGGVGRRLRHHR